MKKIILLLLAIISILAFVSCSEQRSSTKILFNPSSNDIEIIQVIKNKTGDEIYLYQSKKTERFGAAINDSVFIEPYMKEIFELGELICAKSSYREEPQNGAPFLNKICALYDLNGRMLTSNSYVSAKRYKNSEYYILYRDVRGIGKGLDLYDSKKDTTYRIVTTSKDEIVVDKIERDIIFFRMGPITV